MTPIQFIHTRLLHRLQLNSNETLPYVLSLDPTFPVLSRRLPSFRERTFDPRISGRRRILPHDPRAKPAGGSKRREPKTDREPNASSQAGPKPTYLGNQIFRIFFYILKAGCRRKTPALQTRVGRIRNSAGRPT